MTDLRRNETTLTACLSLVLCLAWGPDVATAQADAGVKAAETGSPRDTLRSFIDACNELSDLVHEAKYFYRSEPEHEEIAERALDCIDDSELPAFARHARAGEVAACLKEVLDRVELPPWEEIPGREEIDAAGGIEKLPNYRIPNTRITISRVEQGPRRHEYLFSTGTVERAVRYFNRIQSRPYRTGGPPISEGFHLWYLSAPGTPALGALIDRLPGSLRLGRSWGMANWKWLGLLLTWAVALAVITAALRGQMSLSERAREKGLLWYWLTLAFPIIAALIPLAIRRIAYHDLTLRGNVLYVTDFVSVLMAMMACFVILFATATRIAATVIASPAINPAGMNAQLIRIVSKLTSLVAAVILFLIGGQYLGIPIATLLTSAGIGGLAVALGAQDSLKTLFGTLSLLGDKPFRVGDRVIFKSYDGVVEDIGLRSTSLRLLNGHQVTLPNDLLSGNDIENVARRQFIRRVGLIRIPLDSTHEKLEKAVAIVWEELVDHEGMDPVHQPRVYFDDFTSEGFTIKFYCWYSPPEFWKFKEFNDRLNFNIFRRFEAQGIQFSLPFRHSLWKEDSVQGPLDVNLMSDGGSQTT